MTGCLSHARVRVGVNSVLLVAALAGLPGVVAAAPLPPPPQPTITEFLVPTASSGPFGIAAGPDGDRGSPSSLRTKIGLAAAYLFRIGFLPSMTARSCDRSERRYQPSRRKDRIWPANGADLPSAWARPPRMKDQDLRQGGVLPEASPRAPPNRRRICKPTDTRSARWSISRRAPSISTPGAAAIGCCATCLPKAPRIRPHQELARRPRARRQGKPARLTCPLSSSPRR